MPSLADHQSNNFTKVLLLGDAKSGKTTALASLVEADYELFIIDMDNLLDPLKHAVLARCPEKIGNVHFTTLRDRRKATKGGMVIEGTPKAFTKAVSMIDEWKDAEGDFGRPDEWGPGRILILDSLSRFCDAAYDFRDMIAPAGRSGEKDGRAVYGDAQDAVESALAHLTSDTFRTNVIVICHGQYMDLPDKTTKIFPQGVGQKLSPKIPQYFPTYIRLVNKAGKRTFQLRSTAMIDLAFPPTSLDEDVSADDGLAKIFAALRPQAPVASATKPKSLTLRRV
jgi:hypothetical protein